MQESGHSATINNVSRVKESIEESYKIFSKFSERIIDFLRNSNVIVSYSGKGLIPANIFYNFVKVLTQKNNFELMSSTELSLNIIPYREDAFTILYFMVDLRERNQLLRLMNASSVMQVPLILVTQFDDDPLLRRWIDQSLLISIQRNLDALTTEIVLASLLGFKLAERISGRSDMRIKRENEELFGLTSVVESLYITYESQLNSLLSSKENIDIVYSPSMKSPAYSFYFWLDNNGIYSRILGMDAYSHVKLPHKNTMLLYTSVEDEIAKEIIFRLNSSNLSVNKIQFRFNLDPLTAQVYGSILPYLIPNLQQK